MSEQDSPSRFLKRTGATVIALNALAGCGGEESPAVTPAPSAHTVFETPPKLEIPKAANELLGLLGKYEFTDQYGNDANIAALAPALAGNNVAVSFGFRRCKGICPYVNDALGALGKQVPGLKYITVSSDSRDNASQQDRDAFMQELVSHGMDRRDIIILYPKDRSKQDDLQIAIGSPSAVQPGGPAHTSYIFLYNGDGRQVAKTSGKNDDPGQVVAELLQQAGNALSASRSSSR